MHHSLGIPPISLPPYLKYLTVPMLGSHNAFPAAVLKGLLLIMQSLNTSIIVHLAWLNIAYFVILWPMVLTVRTLNLPYFLQFPFGWMKLVLLYCSPGPNSCLLYLCNTLLLCISGIIFFYHHSVNCCWSLYCDFSVLLRTSSRRRFMLIKE